jgi:signal transduction histidine kinase
MLEMASIPAGKSLLMTRRIEEVSGIRPVTLLIASGITLIIGILAVTSIAANHLREQAIATTESDLVRVDSILATATRNSLLAVDGRLAKVAMRLDVLTTDAAGNFRQAAATPEIAGLLRDDLGSAPPVSAIAAIAGDGSILNRAGSWPVDLPASSLIGMLRYQPQQTSYVGHSLRDPRTGLSLIPVVHRVGAVTHGPIGAVVGLIRTKDLASPFIAAALPPDGLISLLGADGSILLRYPEITGPGAAGEAARTPFDTILGHVTTTMIQRSQGADGEWQIKVVHPLTDYSIAIAVSRNVNQVLAAWAYQGLWYAAFAVGGALAIAVMVYLIARQFQTHAKLAAMLAERIDAERIESDRARLAAEAELLKGERLAVLGNLTATVAHELRNPLSAIRNTLFTIKELATAAGAKFDRPIGRMERSIERCDKIISDLLEYARNRDLKRTSVRFDPWIGDVLGEQAAAAPIVIATELTAGDQAVSLDRDRFQRVIINLVENAAQALAEIVSDREKRIIVRTATVDGELQLTIEDNGPGIKPENLSHIFEPLFSTKSFGTGLGLPTVKHIVDQHGGTIAVDSEVGSGTRVTIRLPLEREMIITRAAA